MVHLPKRESLTLECFQRGSRWCNPSIIHKRPPEQWDTGSVRKACLSALSLQDRYLLTQGIEMVVVYEETDQITTTTPHTGCVASSGSPCPLSATSMEQGHSTQSSFAVSAGLWLEMERRQESVDPSYNHTSPSTWGHHPPREMQVHEREVCQKPLQV